jgi:hypothetical protein
MQHAWGAVCPKEMRGRLELFRAWQQQVTGRPARTFLIHVRTRCFVFSPGLEPAGRKSGKKIKTTTVAARCGHLYGTTRAILVCKGCGAKVPAGIRLALASQLLKP